MKNEKKHANMQEENVTRVISLIEKEGVSLGALVRNFVKVAEEDAFANLMLDSICGTNNAKIVLLVNEIKMRIIAQYPYRNEEGTMLVKKDGIFVEMKEYKADIIKKAYYNAIGVTKKVDFRQATKEEVEEVAKKKEERKVKAAETKAAKMNEQDLYKRFWEECMNAAPADLAAIVQKYKSEEYQKDIKQKIDAAAGK